MPFSKKGRTKYQESINKFLGMNKGTAMHRLKKMIMFEFAKRLGMDKCYRCNLLIEDVSEFSVEHKESWLWKDVKLFWDINNIAFSHLICNSGAANFKKMGSCGSYSKYLRGCKCEICTEKYHAQTKIHQQNRYKRLLAIKKLAKLRTNKEVIPYFKKMKKKYGFTEMNQLIDKLKKDKKR
jgi:hypothetical protein